jgi:hypothetical protein
MDGVLYLAIASLLFGLLFFLFPKAIGMGLGRFQKANLERQAKDHSLPARLTRSLREKMGHQFPQFSPNLDDQGKTAKSIRIMGIVFLVQGAAAFILWAILMIVT